jgi:hypothetical protein
MSPIVKKALAAVALKEVYERVQEARKPQPPSFFARLFKLTLIGALLGGAAYAYKNGLFKSVLGKGGQDSYDGSVTVQRPLETPTNNEPVGAPNA